MKKFILLLAFITTSWMHADRPIPNHNLLSKAWKIYTGGSNGLPYYSLQTDGKHYRGDLPWNLRWNILKDAIDYEGKRILELGCNVALTSIFLKTYCGAESCLAVDMPIHKLKKKKMERLYVAAELTREAFNTRNITIKPIDFDGKDYEEILGYDYDVVFCMSLLNWIQDKTRLMTYLSHFDHVIFEGHSTNAVEIKRFAEHGFHNYEELGMTATGPAFKPGSERTLFHFYK